MPYLMIKVLAICFLTTSLVLNNWVLVVYALLPFIYEHCLHLFLHRLSLSQCPKTSSQTVHRRTSRLQGTIRKQTLQCVNFSARIHIPSPPSCQQFKFKMHFIFYSCFYSANEYYMTPVRSWLIRCRKLIDAYVVTIIEHTESELVIIIPTR